MEHVVRLLGELLIMRSDAPITLPAEWTSLTLAGVAIRSEAEFLVVNDLYERVESELVFPNLRGVPRPGQALARGSLVRLMHVQREVSELRMRYFEQQMEESDEEDSD
jgi:hypothetical protein